MEKSVILEFLNKHGKCINTIGDHFVFPPIICNDGYFISVQAGKFYKSSPAEDVDALLYDEVELRCLDLNVREKAVLQPFNCGHDEYLFCNVPINYVDALIVNHGGIDTNKVHEIIKENKKNKNS